MGNPHVCLHFDRDFFVPFIKFVNEIIDGSCCCTDFFQLLRCLGQPHVDSFNFMSSQGLKLAIEDIMPIEFELPGDKKVSVWIENAAISKPAVPLGTIGVVKQDIYPTECRQRHSTYKGKLCVVFGWSLNGKPMPSITKDVGEVPIMLQVHFYIFPLRVLHILNYLNHNIYLCYCSLIFAI